MTKPSKSRYDTIIEKNEQNYLILLKMENKNIELLQMLEIKAFNKLVNQLTIFKIEHCVLKLITKIVKKVIKN